MAPGGEVHTSPSSMRASCLSRISMRWDWASTTVRRAFISARISFSTSSWEGGRAECQRGASEMIVANGCFACCDLAYALGVKPQLNHTILFSNEQVKVLGRFAAV